MQYDIPILFVIFRRKDVTMRTFAAIKAAQPAKLYIACDGARETVSGEQELVEATRQAVENAIDWPCEVHRRYQDHNQGCAKAVSSAISWIFETEEMGIILEDDCVAKPSFSSSLEKCCIAIKTTSASAWSPEPTSSAVK